MVSVEIRSTFNPHTPGRAWPWVVVGLAAIVIFPDLADPDLGYPLLMLRYLPTGILGLVVASFFAAFMSTVSTQINWGASYLVNDIDARFLNPEATGSGYSRASMESTREPDGPASSCA